MLNAITKAFKMAHNEVNTKLSADKKTIDIGYLLFQNYNVLKTNYDDLWSYVGTNPDLFFGINFKINALFSNSWYIDVVEGYKRTPADDANIEELTNVIDVVNGRDRTFTQTLQQCITEQILLGIAFMERTQKNYFYNMKTSNVVPNYDAKGILLDKPYSYISESGQQVELPPGAAIKLDSFLMRNGTAQDYRQLIPIALLSSVLTVLQATDYARYYQIASFKNGIFPSSTVKLPQGKTLQDTEEFMQYLMKHFSMKSGANSAYKHKIKSFATNEDIELEIPWGAPLVLPDGYELGEGVNMKDLNFQELLDYSERKIFEVLQIPEVIAGARKQGSLGQGKEYQEAVKSYHENVCNAEKEYYSDLLSLRLFKENEKYLKNKGNGIKLSNGTTDLSMYRFVFPKRKFKDDFQIYMLIDKAYERGAITLRAYKENLKQIIDYDDTEKFSDDELDSTYKPPVMASPFGFGVEPTNEPKTGTSPAQREIDIEERGEMEAGEEVHDTSDDERGEKCCHKHIQTIVPSEMTYKLKQSEPVKIFKAKDRNYTKIDLQDKALEKETNTTLYNIAYSMVSKYAADVRKSYLDNNGYNAKELTSIKLKDKNLMQKDFKSQLEKGWQQGKEQMLDDPNISKRFSKKEYEDPGAWDYDQVDAIIELIVTARGGKISQDLVTRLQNEIKNAIRADLPIEDLVAQMLSEDPESILSKIRNYIETEARTALREVNSQSRYDAAVNSVGAEYLQIDATLDGKTTDICRSLNGYIFRADQIPPFGLPPYHWNCRTTINSIFEEDVPAAIAEIGGADSPLNGDPAYAADVARDMSDEFKN